MKTRPKLQIAHAQKPSCAGGFLSFEMNEIQGWKQIESHRREPKTLKS